MARTNIPKPAVHDFTQHDFGHHLTIIDLPDDGETMYVEGCAKNVLVNDFIKLKRSDWLCLYRVLEVAYDPYDPLIWKGILQIETTKERLK